ncbi:uncharacterized protein PAC_11122 [Phialocephala subalpina]|uniref:Uncharacterized protein n=1 Tax=Phialocephala subalpina TaxID=576137 RepID=A0A1L7X888_9HELO|nr:uncharacterized protein PAC_11122 [Phialocephala subalpina]
MSAPNQGRQSPPPEEQSGAQQQDAPSKGTGVNTETKNKDESKDQLKGFESNPKGVLEDHLKDTVSKTMK